MGLWDAGNFWQWVPALGLMLSIGIVSPSLAEEPQNNASRDACVESAITDYDKAKLEILTHSGPILSVEATLAQRRLEESLCLRLAKCLVDDKAKIALRCELDLLD